MSLSFYPRIWKDILQHGSTAVEKICQTFLWNIEQKENFSELLTCSSPFPISFLSEKKNNKKYAGVFFYVFFYAKGDPGGTTYSRQKTAGSLHSLSLQHYGQNVKISSKN